MHRTNALSRWAPPLTSSQVSGRAAAEAGWALSLLPHFRDIHLRSFGRVQVLTHCAGVNQPRRAVVTP